MLIIGRTQSPRRDVTDEARVNHKFAQNSALDKSGFVMGAQPSSLLRQG